MGSFNTYCAYTFQTVAPKERVKIVPVHTNFEYDDIKLKVKDKEFSVKSSIGDSGCYSNSLYSPFALPIRAVYDDYGSFVFDGDEENIDNIKYFLNLLGKHGVTTLAGRNEYHDLPFDPSDMNTDNLDDSLVLDLLEEVFKIGFWKKRIFVTDYNHNIMQLGFAVIHEGAYNATVEAQSTRKNYHGQLISEVYREQYLNQYGIRMAATLYEAMFCKGEVFTASREKIVEKVKSNIGFATSNMRDFWRYSGIRDIDLHPKFDLIGQLGADFVMSNIADAESEEVYIEKMLAGQQSFYDQITTAMVEEFVEPVFFEYLLFNSFVGNTNWRWQPSLYASQDYDNSCGEKYLKIVKQTAETVKAIRKVRWGDDGDDEETDDYDDF